MPHFTPHPDWPAQRSLERYEHLVGFSIRQQLRDGGVFFDVGPGTHAVALRELSALPDVTLVGLTPDKVDIAGSPILLEHGRIPDAGEVLRRYAKGCRVVTDIFSSVTYVEDPALALLALSFLPDRLGKVGVFTELDKFGARKTWREVSNFFADCTGQQVVFEAFNIRGDAEPIWVDCLRITIEGVSSRDVSELPELKAKLHDRLGSPHVGREIWTSKDGKARISEICYGKFSPPSELMRKATMRPA